MPPLPDDCRRPADDGQAGRYRLKRRRRLRSMPSRSSGTARAVSSTPAARWGRYLQRQGLDSAAAYNFTRPPSFPGPMRRLLPKKPIRAISQLTDSANFAISPTAKDSEDNPGNGMTPRVRACCVAALLVYGIDDPLDRDLALGQRLRNEAYFANLIWDVTQAFRVGGEVTYRKTAYTMLRNNDGVGFQFQVQWKF